MANRSRRKRGRPTGLSRNRGHTHNITIGGKVYGAGRRGTRKSARVADRRALMEVNTEARPKAEREQPYSKGGN